MKAKTSRQMSEVKNDRRCERNESEVSEAICGLHRREKVVCRKDKLLLKNNGIYVIINVGIVYGQ